MKYQWKLKINYVPFESEEERDLAYEQYAESILVGLRNKKKAEKTKQDKKEDAPKGVQRHETSVKNEGVVMY